MSYYLRLCTLNKHKNQKAATIISLSVGGCLCWLILNILMPEHGELFILANEMMILKKELRVCHTTEKSTHEALGSCRIDLLWSEYT